MHPSLEGILRGFRFDHLKPGDVQDASKVCESVANYMTKSFPSSAELVAGLRKLLEAKDCFVRAAVYAEEDKARESSDSGEEDKR